MMALYEPIGISQNLRLLPELLHAVNGNIYASVSNLYVAFPNTSTNA